MAPRIKNFLFSGFDFNLLFKANKILRLSGFIVTFKNTLNVRYCHDYNTRTVTPHLVHNKPKASTSNYGWNLIKAKFTCI